MAFLMTVLYKNDLHPDSDVQSHNNTFNLLFCGFSPVSVRRVFLWRLHEIGLYTCLENKEIVKQNVKT